MDRGVPRPVALGEGRGIDPCMIVFESRIARRFVGRLERGEEVIQTLQQLCEHERIRSAWLHGAGILEWVELTEWDAEREAWRAPTRLDGPLTVLSLEGNVAIRKGPPFVQLHVMLSRQTGSSSFETVGGTLSAARVYAIDFAFDVYDDVRLERDEDAQTGLSLFKGSSVRGIFARGGKTVVAPPPSHVPERVVEAHVAEDSPVARVGAESGGISWARAAQASEEAERRISAAVAQKPTRAKEKPLGHLPFVPESKDRGVDLSFLDEPVPVKGDYVDHRQFGVCRVEGEDEDGGVKIRLPSGVRKTIKLDFLEVLPPRHEGDRKVFPLRPRKR